VLLGQFEIFTGIRQVFADRDYRADAGLAGLFQDRIPVSIENRVTHMSVGIHQTSS
jgi:hypothetical protein